MIGEIAKALDGMEYGARIPNEITTKAKENGIVIVYGASDDLMEFEGAITDEVGVYEGGTAYINKAGLQNNENYSSNCEDCPHLKRSLDECKTIEAIWGEGEYSWSYKTEIPHAEFDITEDGEKYCRGIVFTMASI